LSQDRQFFGLRGVESDITFVFLRKIGISKDGLYRAFRDAGTAVNANLRVNDQPFCIFVKTIHGTNGNAVGVFTFDTRFSHNMGHTNSFNKYYFLKMMFLYYLRHFVSAIVFSETLWYNLHHENIN
jgi:hypothetical protein